ncbi:OmpA family protein [Reichenbachiella sp.]|uniref:OmpA family protein n=1 Tax=Reichenbachiella sp. TaxID=2184521 RepID=UPI003BB04009
MYFRKCTILVILLSLSYWCYSQDVEKLEKKAQKHFYAEELLAAAQEYEQVLKIDSDNRTAAYRLVICNALLDPRNSSMSELLKYKSTQGKRDKFYYYWLGRAYFHQNQFKKAADSWNKFLSLDKYKSSTIIEETKFFIDWAERAEIHHSLSENYEIDQLPEPINSESIEFSPVYFSHSNELLFLSDRRGDGKQEPFQTYHSIRSDGVWSEPTLLKQFGSFEEKNANIEVVNESSKIYLYRGDKKGSLYSSFNDEGNWTKPETLSRHVSDSKLESHFFINEDENTILFAHRKKGKTADLDIFISRLDPENNHWTKPELLSEILTSDLDEDYPYLSADGNTLYFSSKGFGSIGGYDVFKSEFDATENSWSRPVSLGYPTNSIGHDIQFKINATTNSGYFVSDRLSAMGGYDIFFFHESNKILLTGTIIDSKGMPAEGAEIHFYPKRNTGLELKTMTDQDGKYEVNVGSEDQLKIEIFFHDELVYQESIQTPSAAVGTLKKNFSIDQEKKQIAVTSDYHDPAYTDVENIGSKFRPTNKALLSNIYFGFGEVELATSETQKLEPLLNVMKENPELNVEIAGHTDNIGDGRTNLKISVLRARAVAQYLIDHGVAEDRAVAKGYGYAIPLASNDQEKEGRELNRRIEVLVLE